MRFDMPKGEFVIPSGIVASTPDIIWRISKEIAEIGVITTKSIGLAERDGNKEPIVSCVGGSMVNAVGLSNPGVDSFLAEVGAARSQLSRDGKVLMISIFGGTPAEFAELAAKVEKRTDWIELNLSCPHAQGYGAAIGTCPGTVSEVVSAVRGAVAADMPVFAKIVPSLGLAGLVARRAEHAGADGITAVNTVGPLSFSDPTIGIPLLSNVVGGLSGNAIREVALKCVREVRESTSVPIIGMGGIGTGDDVSAFRSAGASLFGIGTALTSMNTVSMKSYFRSLASGSAFPFGLAGLIWSKLQVKEVWGNGTRVLVLDGRMGALPGQFVFLWIQGVGEKPFSLASNDPITLLVKAIGPVSSHIASLCEGSEIMLRGPYGNGYAPSGSACLVGGGSGVAPVYFIAKGYKDKVEAAFIGGRKSDDLPLYDSLKGLTETSASTEDGSLGHRGLVTEILCAERHQGAEFFNCGPEPMLVRVAEQECRATDPSKIFCAVERYTKCGVGICGSCALDGYRTCVDGPVFPYPILKEGKDFGKCKRRASGRLVPLNG
jgi:dihydroorotate dehydrogenase subfamily 1